MLPVNSKLRSSTESEKAKLLKQREQSLIERESELARKEAAL